MVAQQNLKTKNKPLRSEIKNRDKNKKSGDAPASIGASKARKKISTVSDNTTAETRKDLKPAETHSKPEREPHKKSRRSGLKTDENPRFPLHTGQELKAHIRRDSFVVRLSVDENNEFGRVEVEHIASSKKQNFPDLNGEYLVAFMKECMTPMMNLVSPERIELIKERIENHVPDESTVPPTFTFSGIRLISSGMADTMSLTLMADKPFTIQAHFQLHNPEAFSPSIDESNCEVTVYVTEITSGMSRLLVTHSTAITWGPEEYIVPIQVLGLPQGLYRLFTVVKVNGLSKIASWYDGPVIQVI